MKKYALITFILLLCLINYVSAENKTLPLLTKVIYLDPGHGGYSYTRCTLKIKLKYYNTRVFELFYI